MPSICFNQLPTTSSVMAAAGPVPYDDYDAHRPLETGMVVSVETTLQHPKRGFIKSVSSTAGANPPSA